jgi:RNA polymerase sigma factor (TIGR02999 family)
LRLVGEQDRDWQNRAHFFGVAANIMRNLMIDHARARKRGKRGGGGVHVTLEEPPALAVPDPDELLDLEEALTRLTQFDSRAARVVELRYFVGLRLDEIALIMDISEKTVRRDWTMARTWLQAELRHAKGNSR